MGIPYKEIFKSLDYVGSFSPPWLVNEISF